MRNFLLGAVSALVLVGILFAAYTLVIYPQRYGSSGAAGDCARLRPASTEVGKLGVEVGSRSGRSVDGIEVDLGERPGAETYCWTKTDAKGLALFDNVPVGDYVVYFNESTLPPDLRGGSPVLRVTVTKGITSEAGIQLK